MARRKNPGLFRMPSFARRPAAVRSPMRMEALEERLAPAALPTPTVLAPTATVASVALLQQVPSGANNNTTIDYFNPQVVADPLNPLNQVLVATRYASNANGTTLSAVVRYTTDGGVNWTTPGTGQLATVRDPGTTPTNNNATPQYPNTSSAAVAFGRDGNVYFVWLAHSADKSRGALLFTKVAFNGGAGNPTGAATSIYQWVGGDKALNPTVAVDNNTPIYTDPLNPTVPVADPMANRSFVGKQAVYVAWNSDSSANPNDVTTNNATGRLNFNPNPILSAVSGDDGATWSNPIPVSNGGFLTPPDNSRGVAPQIAFAPGNAGTPGALVFVWTRQTAVGNTIQNYAQVVTDVSQPDNGNANGYIRQAYTVTSSFTAVTGLINDATAAVAPATFDGQSQRTFNLNVPAGTVTDPNFSLQDLSVNLAVVAPFLNQLRVELIAPNGATITLLNNRTRGDGTDSGPTPLGNQSFPTGYSGTLPGYTPSAGPRPFRSGLGIQNEDDIAIDMNTYTVFSDAAARRVNDPNSAFPLIGAYRAEGNPGYSDANPPTALLRQFLTSAGLFGAGAAAINGTTWQVRITDLRADRLTLNNNPYTADEFLQTFGLVFSSQGNNFGTDTALAGALTTPIGVDYNDAPLTGPGSASPAYPGTAPVTGIPSTVSVAFDTSLGSASPFGGSIYVAYTSVVLDTSNPQRITDTNIQVVRGSVTGTAIAVATSSQVNDDTPFDNFTEGNRPQFLPAVTVDATTGTVVASWYDTRLDANKTRAATFVATNNNGGAAGSWSDQTITVAETADGTRPFLNQPKTAIDLITGTNYTLQPVPTNVPLATSTAGGITTALGVKQSVIAAGGKIYAYWAGNNNAAGMSIQSARAVTAAGPRVDFGDLGPVLAASSAGGIPYNNTLAADGTRQLDGFVVQFDRPVEAGSATSPGSAINPANYVLRYHNPYDPVGTDTVIPITSVVAVGGNQFLVRFAPQSRVGTYSYAVLPSIRDEIRTQALFPSTDTPLAIPDGPTGVVTSTLAVPAQAGTSVVVAGGIRVRLNLAHARDGDLRITLIGPDGTSVVLANQRGGAGANFTNTVFDDAATTLVSAGTAPFTGLFKPETPLAAFVGKPLNGNWQLKVEDLVTGNVGTLTDWSLEFVVSTGNFGDQNANSVTQEVNVDTFAMPNPTGGVPFVAPYKTDTKPLIIPGPYLTGSAVVNGGSLTDPKLVLAGVASAVDVTFDRDMNLNPANGPVFTAANVVRLTGPAGVIYDRSTATFNPLTVVAQNARTFRITFPGQVLNGTYTIEIDPLFAGVKDVLGTDLTPTSTQRALVDTNQNAGIDVLQGGDPTTGATIDQSYNASYTGAAATIAGAAGSTATTTEFPLTVPDSFVINTSAGHQIQVVLNVSDTAATSRNTRDLTVDLVAPDGVTTVRLFRAAGNPSGPAGTLWFSNTILRDDANTPILTGVQPFSAGPYNPQFPLNTFDHLQAVGTWKLRVTNAGGLTPSLTSWSLRLPQVIAGTNLGEPIADRLSVSFRIFNQDPSDPLTQKSWTPVGPAAENGQGNSARTNGLAVDPSDPSGNTVYLGAASGGLWKTTNFMTTDAAGPTWIPLIDSGPTYSLNVVSVAVFPRNGDPGQSIIFALTGEGDTDSPGVGVLRSMDGGKTWVVLDSLNNAGAGTTFGGTVSPIADPSRDRTFFNKTAFKIIVDPTAQNDPERNVIVYAAFGGANGGVYRSTDTGRHWTLMRAGDATDIVLAEGSAAIGTGNLQILYAAFRGDGVYIANPAFVAVSMAQMTGTPPGNGSFIQGDLFAQTRLPINAPSATPNGAKGRIMLATPALTNDKVKDLNYQGWLYALVITPAGGFDGLYLTKDFGGNWTKVSLPAYLQTVNGAIQASFGTNDYTQADHDAFAGPSAAPNPLPGQGNYDVGFAIDPLNPNVVYIGGTNDTAYGPFGKGSGGFIRVDTTGVMDALAAVAYDNGAAGTNAVQFTQAGGNAVVAAPASPPTLSQPQSPTTNANGQVNLGPGFNYGFSFGPSGTNTGYLNVLHDPNDPFNASSPVYFRNVTRIQNTGVGARYSVIFPEVETDVHRIITFVDPITKQTRLIVGDDQGVSTAVDDGRGNLIYQLGSGNQQLTLPGQIRNGNLQTVQFYSSTTQPSQLAAEIAAAMFYGVAQDDGFPVSNAGILQSGVGTSGNLSWDGPGGDGTWGLTDPTGTGTYYLYQWPCCNPDGPNDFFVVNGTTRSLFLIQPGDNPQTGAGQWPRLGGVKFAVNPIDPNGLAISSTTGNFFLSTNQGRTWFQVTGPGTPNAYAQAIAYGAPDSGVTNPNQYNNFIYAGFGTRISVTFNGGSSWTNISTGLSGTVQQIVPDTARGSRAVYAVTDTGVFFKADAGTAAPWVNITGNLFTESEPIFDEANPPPQTGLPASLRSITSLAVDWRYAVADPFGPSPTFPVLYVGGYGGVFRSTDRGATWEVYPQGTTYTYTDGNGQPASIDIPDGGYLPAVEVTQLTLSQGNIDPVTGQPLQQTGGLNLLTAATYGRGTWVIRLGTPENDPAIQQIVLDGDQVVKQSGPQVIGVDVVQQPTGATNAGRIRVSFSSPVLASSFDASDIVIRDASGNPLTIGTVTPIQNLTPPVGYPTVPPSPLGTVDDYHNLFEITYTAAGTVAAGFGTVTIGPDVFDYAGFRMNQNDNFFNGETQADPNNGGAAADAYNGFQFLNPAGVAGNLHISMPVVATAGGPTRVVVSALSPTTGLPDPTYTGTVSLTATINGQPVAFTTDLDIQILSLSQSGTTVTVTTLGPALGTVPFAAGQTVKISGVGTAGYNGEFVVLGVTATGFTYTNPTTGLAPDTAGGGLASGPKLPVAAQSGTPTPLPSGALPTTYTFTAADGGSKVFTLFYPVGSNPTTGQTQLSVVDTSSPAATRPNDARAVLTVAAGAAAGFIVTGPTSPVVAGTALDFTVKAVDAYGNVVPDYVGTVTFTTTDTNAAVVLPSAYTFTTADAGVHTFSSGVVLATASDFSSLTSYTTVFVEDTTNPNTTLKGNEFVKVSPAAAASFTVVGTPLAIVAGNTVSATVTAFDRFGNVATGYTGTVAFSTADAQGTFAPTTYTFTAADAGVHSFPNLATLRTAGSQFIAATDTVNSAITGRQNNILVSPAATTRLSVAGFPPSVVAGVAGSFTVTAQDQFGNTTPTYTGTVSFSTNDAQGTFAPTSYTFVSGDAGIKTFTNGAILRTAGTRSITATDTVTSSITGTQAGITVTPAAASTLTVGGFPTPVVAGTAGTFTVTAFDSFGNVATGYRGTVGFSTGDAQGTFSPVSYQFLAGDAGVRTFTNGATLRTAGTQRITATDTATASIAGSQTGITVTPAATSKYAVTGFPPSVVAGVAGTFTVTAQDAFGNTTPTYTGTVGFTTDDTQGTFAPATYTFVAGDAGVRTFTNGATLRTAGTRRITATDTVSASITGAQAGITVTPAAASTLTVGGFPTPIVAGIAGTFTVTAKDPFGNVATGYRGTVGFTTSDAQGTFNPTSYSFLSGDAGVHTFTNGATLRTAGTQQISATDTTTGTITGTQTGITVTPAATAKYAVTGFPNPVVAGVAGTFTVTAQDQFGNTTPAYAGTVSFSTDDTQGTFAPGTYTFVAGDAGIKTLTNGATLRTAGTRRITATDTLTASITGVQTGITVTPAAASRLTVGGFPTSVVAGTAGGFTVTAFDPFDNVAAGYTGTVAFTTTDPQGTFTPATYTFVAGDSGARTFNNGATLRTAGTQSISATDTTTGTITGSQAGISVTPAATTRFLLTGLPAGVSPGSPITLTVAASDAFGNATPTYVGTVTLSSSDTEATINPRAVAFGAADAGTRTLPGAVSFRRSGPQSVTASDRTGATGTANTLVAAPVAATFRLTNSPNPVISREQQTITVTALDIFGDPVTTYLGSLSVTTTDGSAVLPTRLDFTAADNGTKTFPATFNAVGDTTVTVTDVTNAALKQTLNLRVQPKPGTVAARFEVTVSPPVAGAGSIRTVTVRAVDTDGVLVPEYAGTVAISTTDPAAQVPPAATLTNGVGVFAVTLRTVGAQTVGATDGTLSGSQAVTVGPPTATVAVGSDTLDRVAILNQAGVRQTEFTPFPGTTGGTRVATGDVTGDGVDDFIFGTGPGVSTRVVVMDGKTGNEVFAFDPFEASFTGGVFVAAGDVNGDGVAEIAVTPDQGGGPRVILIRGGDFQQVASFFGIDDPNFRGGARAAIGDVNADGFGDIAVAAGFLGGPRVSVRDGKALLQQGVATTLFNDFFIFGGADVENLRNGVFIAVGDVNGDGFADLIGGGGPGGGPRVLAADGQSLVRNNSANPVNIFDFYVRGLTQDRGGVRVAAKSLDGDSFADVIVGDGEGIGSTATAFKGRSLAAGGFDTLFFSDVFPGVRSGVYVG